MPRAQERGVRHAKSMPHDAAKRVIVKRTCHEPPRRCLLEGKTYLIIAPIIASPARRRTPRRARLPICSDFVACNAAKQARTAAGTAALGSLAFDDMRAAPSRGVYVMLCYFFLCCASRFQARCYFGGGDMGALVKYAYCARKVS